MQPDDKQRIIAGALEAVRKRMIAQAALDRGIQAALWLWPAAALLLAFDARWLGGALALPVLSFTLLAPAVLAGRAALQARADPLKSAITLDQRAGLKSRVSSALEFLVSGPLDGPRTVQVSDALAHLQAFDWQHHFALRWPRHTRWAPALALAMLAALWIPPAVSLPAEDAPVLDAALRAAQAGELAATREALARLAGEDPLAKELEAELHELEQRLETGGMDEREVMIALSRMESALAERLQQGDVGALAREAGVMAAPLQAAEPTKPAGESLARRQPTEAAEALEQLAAAAAQQQLSNERMSAASQAMQMAAARLRESGSEDGQPQAGQRSFASDLEQASQALEEADAQAFQDAMQRMGDKLGQVQQFQNMEAMRQEMNAARGAIGLAQHGGRERQEGAGMSVAEGDDSGLGGNMAGVGEHGQLDGDPERLEDSLRQILAVRGQLGEGPVQSRVEITEGRLSASSLEVREALAEYAAVAEEAIERESVPLSHRQHVRRYFEAIRLPAEQPEPAAP